ncbi:DUF1993 domain-containing protein [Novosphingobium olei]|uniref:DUF1993 domain-containing protein n=1 Tax=Novosphingobium olei TaxID=2728851 RepID=A0A7Y0BQK6_9SPHN|nr:DUF1993 domain-containing protein [Novosphingobium olei]NML94480.1 DUF1993 domain-containing protein [Novosphingobium olei]
MSFSLYAATVPTYRQILGALDKAEAFCTEQGIDPSELVGARLIDDMLPLGFQVKQAAVHSLGAIAGAKQGQFSPSRDALPDSFTALKAVVAEAQAGLEALSPADVDGLAGHDVAFVAGDFRLQFVAEEFLMTFSLPNFYFHASTAYNILRAKGVPIGKRDFLGQLRLKQG